MLLAYDAGFVVMHDVMCFVLTCLLLFLSGQFVFCMC